MTPFTLNGREYLFELALIRRGYSAIEISLNNVMRVSIVNDSYEPFPRMKLVVKDPNSQVVPYFEPDNNSKIVFTVVVSEKYGDEEYTIVKSHLYNIDKVKPLNMSGESNTYEISAVSELLEKWLNPVQYSSGRSQSTTVSACEILAKTEIPYAKPIKESSHKRFYIADVNSTTRDHVNRLLDFASFSGDGFYYTWFDMITNKLYIESTKGLIKNGKFQPYNIIAIPSGEFGSGEVYTPKSVHHTNDVPATVIDSISRGIREFNFDFKAGGFFERKMEYVDIKNGSTIQNLEPVIDNTIRIDKDTNYTQMATGHDWYGEIRRAVRSYNTVQMVIEGTVQRGVGDLVILNSSESMKYTFGGVWMTMRSVDTFDFGAGKFDQTITVSRVGKV